MLNISWTALLGTYGDAKRQRLARPLSVRKGYSPLLRDPEPRCSDFLQRRTCGRAHEDAHSNDLSCPGREC